MLISTFRLRRPPGCGRRRERPSDKVNIVLKIMLGQMYQYIEGSLVHPTPPTSPAGEEVLASSATSKTKTTVTKEKIQEEPGEGEAQMAEEEEHSTVAEKRTMPRNTRIR